MDAKKESVETMVKALPSHGVTSFLPTLEAAPLDALQKAMGTIVSMQQRKLLGSKILGVNLEGPFLSNEKPGAMKPEYIRAPSIEELRELYKASAGSAKLITIAPESPGAIELIEYAVSLGLTVSMGHTNATYRQAAEAIRAGASHVTHLFNAMRAFHHREPGIVGAALENAGVSVELVADLVHLHPTTIRLVRRVKPVERIVTVSDSVLADSQNGLYRTWEGEVTVKENVATLADGTIAGSMLTMDKGLRNLVLNVGIPVEEALMTMTINPARVIGLHRQTGSIEKGKRADFVVMDEQFRVQKAFVEGRIAYDRNP
jgi:N-acetylglucosamine-6-phosphate deacetylase